MKFCWNKIFEKCSEFADSYEQLLSFFKLTIWSRDLLESW